MLTAVRVFKARNITHNWLLKDLNHTLGFIELASKTVQIINMDTVHKKSLYNESDVNAHANAKAKAIPSLAVHADASKLLSP